MEGGMMEKQVKKSNIRPTARDDPSAKQLDTKKKTDARNGMRDNFKVEGSAKE